MANPQQYAALTEFTLGQGGQPLFEYEIAGRPAFAHISLKLKPGQQCIGESGAMLWMDGTVTMEVKFRGGCAAMCRRTCCGGEKLFQNAFTGPGTVAFGIDMPGDILPFKVDAQTGWVLNKGAYMSGSLSAMVSAKWKGCCFCMYSGEGGFLTHVFAQDGAEGIFFAGGYGMIERHDVGPEEIFMVDVGLFFAAPETIQPEIGCAGGCLTCCCGGEFLVMKFKGPTVIFTQSHSPRKYFNMMPVQRKKKGGPGAMGAAM